eukprot:CAMPEP_0185595722 /NCGR_PEP_ID=MMETSP0434-20130131/79270_1 /TAXON_ID=626734 ORGANISM="Favella taraikaensis, Strain Fe Narragansett Bay" /NCGR_SAMPLE_ID=MMETSP0434 /ASSEMBLY_ACC=CAM_ASM_000379 /LENGTH=112 /DNA_ID=CAMNT_0028223903 /DNA_START=458 /DNA_END=796 /DNA_ORIENTATION=+
MMGQMPLFNSIVSQNNNNQSMSRRLSSYDQEHSHDTLSLMRSAGSRHALSKAALADMEDYVAGLSSLPALQLRNSAETSLSSLEASSKPSGKEFSNRTSKASLYYQQFVPYL